MRRSEEKLFASGAAPEPLMDRAGFGVAEVVNQFFPRPGRLEVFAGRGNNGGDALVAAVHLMERGWSAQLHLAAEKSELSPLAAKKLRAFKGCRGGKTSGGERGPVVRLDGLLGIGASGPLRGRIGEAAREINRRRFTAGGATVAVDIPTGLDGDSGEPVEDAVRADITVTMARVKAGLVADAAINFVGRIALVPLDEIVPVEGDEGAEVLSTEELKGYLPVRDFDTHKGMAGRVAVVAGSRGFTGAALLCARGALRGGAGLVTLYALEEIYPILATAAAAAVPEIMVSPVANFEELAEANWDVLAAGPGLGVERGGELLELVRRESRPIVMDADLLNAVAAAGPESVFSAGAGDRLLTPHPGEMERLTGHYPAGRRAVAEAFAERFPVAVLLKGARSVIAQKGRATVFNSTGHPGMASGGMGDVLTGICAALVAEGLACHPAAALGSWLLGRGAEIAVSRGERSVESMTAGDVIEHLGGAFDDLRRGCY